MKVIDYNIMLCVTSAEGLNERRRAGSVDLRGAHDLSFKRAADLWGLLVGKRNNKLKREDNQEHFCSTHNT